MAKTETQINLKINKGTYEKIQENLNSISDNELIITTDKNIPVPTNNDNGKFFKVVNGDYSLKDINGYDVQGSYATVADSTALGNLTKVEGALAYNQADDKIYMCDGTNWSEWDTGTPTITISNISGTLTADQLAIITSNYDKPIILISTGEHCIYFKNASHSSGQSNYTQFTCDYINHTIMGEKSYYHRKIFVNESNGQYSQTSYKAELTQNKVTSMSGNTTSTYKYPSCSALNDFVKAQTKYKVVNDYSVLPTTNLEKGLLVYCKNYDSNLDAYAGFYYYNGSSWEHKAVFNEAVNKTISSNFDETQTYNLTLTSDEFLEVGGNSGSALLVSFNDTSFALKLQVHNTGTYTYNSTSLVTINNTPYIATLDFDLSQNSDNTTLSFSSVGGSASESFTQFKLKTQESGLYQNWTYIIPDDKQSIILAYANALLSSNYTTIDQLFTFMNTAIGSGSTDAQMIYLYAFMIELFSKLTPFKVLVEYQYQDDPQLPVEESSVYSYSIFYDNGVIEATFNENNANIQITPTSIYQVEYSPYSFGGGSGTSEKYYKWQLVGSINDFTGNNTYIAYANESQMQEIYTGINTAMGLSISTPAEIITIYNSVKGDDLSSSPYFALLCSLFTNVAQYSMENGKPTYLKEGDNGANAYPTRTVFGYMVYTQTIGWFVDELTDVTVGSNIISFDANSTLTITEV